MIKSRKDFKKHTHIKNVEYVKDITDSKECSPNDLVAYITFRGKECTVEAYEMGDELCVEIFIGSNCTFSETTPLDKPEGLVYTIYKALKDYVDIKSETKEQSLQRALKNYSGLLNKAKIQIKKGQGALVSKDRVKDVFVPNCLFPVINGDGNPTEKEVFKVLITKDLEI